MLDKILQTLNGHGSEVASLEAASLQRARDRNAAVAELEELNRRRHAALLADAPDSELDKLERPFSPHYDRERFGRPPTRDELIEAPRRLYPDLWGRAA